MFSPQVDLSSAMTAEALQPILTNEEFVNQLRPYLPATSEELPPTEQLRGTVTSPQFQQVLIFISISCIIIRICLIEKILFGF